MTVGDNLERSGNHCDMPRQMPYKIQNLFKSDTEIDNHI